MTSAYLIESETNRILNLIDCRLGENPILSVVFYNFIADRFKDGDYTGSLVTSIMEASVPPVYQKCY